MKKIAFILVFACIAVIANGQQQGSNADFEKFAQAQSALIVAAYDHKDAKGAEKAAAELQASYNKLTEKEKADYKGVITDGYYNLACTYALTGDKKHALDALEHSEFYDYGHLVDDADLNTLRKDPRFIKYMAKAKALHPDHITVLKSGAVYGTQSTPGMPAWTYQSASDEHLALLRKTYNLDSIAGYGTDVSQMINLMRWVHNLIPHNGNKGNPDVKNALSLITECRRDGKTLNCRGLGIVLNEVYLAQGFKSRYITCLPKDTADQDCHVITMVYSLRLNKWIWMDPTFNAYVMDENGNLLGLEEVRTRLISNKPLLLNPDADHNHENSQTKKDYLEDYMAKNLYKLECAVSSEYDYETPGENKARQYITLIPGSKAPAANIEKDSHGMEKYTEYFTTDPKVFWKLPAEEARAGYDAAMAKFMQYYNTSNADGIRDMFSDAWGEQRATIYTAKKQADLEESYGTLKSYKFLGVDDDGTLLYKVVYDKSTHAMGILLDSKGKILNFRPKTSSSYISTLLAKG